MRSPLHRPALVLVLALSLLRSARVFAADEPEPGSASYSKTAEASVISYDAPSDCPPREAYAAQVEQRLGSDWKPSLEELAQRVNVTITRVGESYLGTLEFVSVEGQRFSRVVSGTICSNVVDGLGLITALAVRARVERAAEHSEPTESPGGTAPNASVSKVRDPARHPAAVPGGSHPARATRNAHLRFGGRASVTSGVGPGVAFGPGAFAGLEFGSARFGLGVDAFDARDVQASRGKADFRLWSARLEACPWSLRLAAWATLEPCAMGELGSFRVAPEVNPPRVTVSEPKAVAWGALGALGRVVFRAEPFVAMLDLLGRLPLRREHFYVGDRDQIVFRVPPLSVGASVGLGVRF